MTKDKIVSGLGHMARMVKKNAEVRIACNSELADMIKGAYELLKPEPVEMEGGGSNWWYVCPECHGSVKYGTRFCGSCGKEIIWK